ncbi:RNA 2',3'-cyclic phosphodiesterase [Nocardioides sp. HDW12B]|uniref:RNA 2',3'-cyclic phosphodiesterase n=1 Tax=Nocardioides sp. HDW12B TaxID=2714939 RepID=UPI001408B3AD|nr:RNA 2',3'-cyclic phosphodiesterase [Nocardioides sp. HDW12B]QIK67696.1 RNA 2',3'-cyclic phosphodiesterase [Nocardioides sp. HDW12B]
MRMFVAIRPPDHVIEDLDDFLAPRREASRLRWTHPDTWHLTLAFMADVPDRSRDELEERLGEAAARRRPFDLRLAGGGAFPDPTRAKVLYADVRADDPVELDRLAVGARNAAATSGAPPDGAAFVPHLTLARMNRPVEATRWLRVLGAYDGPTWTVDEVELVASHLGEGPRNRPRHEPVATFGLVATRESRHAE